MKHTFREKYGEWAVVTGATSGIGSEIASQIAQQGLNLLLVSRNEQRLDNKARQLQEAYGVEVQTVQADLSHQEDNQRVIIASENLNVGLFVACAGMETHGTMTEMDQNTELAMIQLNVTSLFTLTHYYAQQMSQRERGGFCWFPVFTA
ncbi:SDR family NAD(P)-dependent oxidoreductase [Dongshaea marina]|uniref:SDR family NAD(P)-dependent oxidoreductase n=1 Tax=Dongshaea marina TaxID=2047966 RepID=UPI000D3EA378|nr:SDR family NAD(P)-dependent oxidoreductase [Dongshaea marina]